MAGYDDEIGWTRIGELLPPERAGRIGDACEALLGDLGPDLRVGDKPHSGTRRLADVVERIPETEQLIIDLTAFVTAVLGPDHRLSEATYRCPQPGFGQQKLHTDDVPRLEPGPNRCATAIVALDEFTEENGATRVVPGSNHRYDLQRKAGNIDRLPGEIRLTGPAGTAFVFSGHLLHSGVRNGSDRPRPALQFTYRTGGS